MRISVMSTGVVMAMIMFLILASACSDNQNARPDNQSSDADVATPDPRHPSQPITIQFVGGDDLSDEGRLSLADLVERIQSSVVQIETPGSNGTGFIIGSDGIVVTNEHVVGGTRTVTVWTTSGRRYNGDVLERNVGADLALVQIDSKDRFADIVVGDPDKTRVGDEVLALGFPLADRIGSNLTVTRGIISSTRKVAGVDLFQTDAAINPGNSGGPLVNMDGAVIGVNTSKIDATAGGRPVDNIGFAVSVIELERRLSTSEGHSDHRPWHAHANLHSVPDSHTFDHTHAFRYANSVQHPNYYPDSNGDVHSHPDIHSDDNPSAHNHARADEHSYTNANLYANNHLDANGNINAYVDAHTDSAIRIRKCRPHAHLRTSR